MISFIHQCRMSIQYIRSQVTTRPRFSINIQQHNTLKILASLSYMLASKQFSQFHGSYVHSNPFIFPWNKNHCLYWNHYFFFLPFWEPFTFLLPLCLVLPFPFCLALGLLRHVVKNLSLLSDILHFSVEIFSCSKALLS
uniref:Uncharacterized protein n=1 Tax=Cacopsylla melanoneura TaxID=428564 RepID=A0A8D9BCA3_9HEMI